MPATVPSRGVQSGRGSGGRGGFSLIELVVVVIIVGIIAGIAVPRFASSISYHRAEAAATRIVRDIALTQAHAKATSTSQKIAFNVATDSYEVSGMGDINHSADPYVVNMAAAPYEARILFASFYDDQELIFDGYGRPDSGGSILIQTARQKRTVFVDEVTGTTFAFDPVSNPMGG